MGRKDKEFNVSLEEVGYTTPQEVPLLSLDRGNSWPRASNQEKPHSTGCLLSQAVSLALRPVWVWSRLSSSTIEDFLLQYPTMAGGLGMAAVPSSIPLPLPLPCADCCLFHGASWPDPPVLPRCFNLGSSYLILGSSIFLPNQAARSVLLKYLLTSSLPWAADRNASLGHPGQ